MMTFGMTPEAIASSSKWISEFFYVVIGLIFVLVGMLAVKDTTNKKRITTALFWYIMAFTFIAGPYLPYWITGLAVVASACITGLRGVSGSKCDVPTPEATRANADKIGWMIFAPALALAIVAVLTGTFLPWGGNNGIGFSAIIALLMAFGITKAPIKSAVVDGSRLMDNVGPTGILPQMLAALGALFTAAGVGDLIAKGVATIIPDGSKFIACVVYCVGMALFTAIMGNGFAAFSVITVGIGIPFLILQGANPVVVGALGLTAGYCGTLLTPMAANFNIMPAALLETKNKYVIIQQQAPVALILLAAHIALMYFWAF